jgi:peptidoglycan/xylan/chitin deacetylase (PgdA/CDA1 family)
MPIANRFVASSFKSSVLWAYRLFTARLRARRSREFHETGRVPIAILFYHRIANNHPNTWSMSPRNFASQLDWLQRNFDVVSLAEAQKRIRSAANDRPTVAITFDDGYAQNMEHAFPELERRRLPATYFVATHFTASGEPFPHDLAEGLPLAPNTINELRQIASMGIELGAHTRHHLDVGTIACNDELHSEIVGSAKDLEDWCGVQVNYFSFPTGLPANTSQLAVDIIREAGFHGFCTAYGAWNWPGQPGFHLRRIHADPGLQSLKNWLTLDPRKLTDHHFLPFAEPLVELRSNREVSLASCS